jgi:Leucine-rich repeat (LRR) protein
MLIWQELSQQLQQSVNSIVRFVKARKREEATISLAALLSWLGYSFPKLLTPELHDWISSWRYSGLLIIPGIFYTAGAVFLCYGGYRIWQLVLTPDLPPPKDRPSAIKGPIAFAPADGELFRRLGREDELGKLLGFIEDDQVRLVVLMGASGVGKTSLLRAGLTDILKNKGIDYHYWEAMPTSPGQRLLRAIQESWSSGAARDDSGPSNPASVGKPEALEDLVNPSSALGARRHVIVLDQFEQLHGSSTNGPVLRLLRKVAREAKPPHRVTWIVAFRREFRAEWEDFTLPEKARGIYPAEISMRLFTAEQALDVIGQLFAEAQLSIQQKVVDNLVAAATVDGEVSPVDIGIGLLVLAELHDRQGGQTVTLDDYQFAGGAEGLLTQYISRCLDTFPETDRQTILNSMLALREPGTNQRIAEGRSCAELAQETKADASLLKTKLERLTQRDMRLLEIVAPSDESDTRYRLPHERLIPALHRMAGQLLAEVDQAKLRFENAFTAWKNSDRSGRYLLKAGELRAVERYETQIPWGKDAQDKRAFLRRSRHRRTLGRLGITATIFCLLVVGWLANLQYQRYDAQIHLTDNHYPPELYGWQDQVKILKLDEFISVQRFPWLRSNTLEELIITVPRDTNSLDGLAASLARCHTLKKLTLNLDSGGLHDLTMLTRLPTLTQLTIKINADGMRDLTPLSQLPPHTQLSLDITGRRISDLTPLTKLPTLKQLTLDLIAGDGKFPQENEFRDLMSLTQIPTLTQLNLYINGTEVSDLTPLTKLTALTQLTLDIRYSKVRDLTPLTQMPALTQLNLYISDSEMHDLTPLSRLTKLTQLNLDIGSSEISDLTPLTKLPSLTQFTLNITNRKANDLTPLTKLPSLTQLTLNISGAVVFRNGSSGMGSSVSDLTPLTKLTALTQLNLNVTGSEVRDLTSLTKLPALMQLTLDLSDNPYAIKPSAFLWGSNASHLTPLTKLPSLTQLNLHLRGSQVRDLTLISQLSALTQLTLDISNSQVNDLTPLTKLTKLTQLTLDISYSQVNDLTPLTKLTKLTQLDLDNGDSDLTPLSRLNSCQTLKLRLSTYQRMSLKAIPPSVTHLEF